MPTFHHRDYVNAWNTHAADKIAEHYAENAYVEAPEAPQALRGRDAIRKNVQAWLDAFPEVSADVEHVAQDGQTVAMLVHYAGTQTGALALGGKTLPATNRKIELPVAIFLNIDQNGKIQKERDVYDMMSLVTQLGLSPEQVGMARTSR